MRVSKLKRVRFGPVFLPSGLHKGHWLALETGEVAVLSSFLKLQAWPTNTRQILRKSKVLIPYPGLGT